MIEYPTYKQSNPIGQDVFPLGQLGQIERRQNLAPALDLSIRCSDEAPALESTGRAPRSPDLTNQALPVTVIFNAAGVDALRCCALSARTL